MRCAEEMSKECVLGFVFGRGECVVWKKFEGGKVVNGGRKWEYL